MPSYHVHPCWRQTIAYGLSASLLAAILLLAPSNAAANAANQAQAAQIALQRSGDDSKVLSVETQKNSDGSVVYAVKILTGGRVRIFRIPQSR